MSARSLGLISSCVLAACAAQPEPQVATAAPPVVVDVGDDGGALPHATSASATARAASDEEDADADPADAREQALKEAAQAGILGVLQGQPTDLTDVFGPGGLGQGSDGSTRIGGLVGGPMSGTVGAGGLGLSGTGRGGGGTGEAVGLGGIGTIGRGGGGSGTGYGSGAGRLGGAQRSQPPRVTPQAPGVVGTLDKEIIRRIVRRHVNQVRYCYERELAKSPSLQGRLRVRFTIGSDGHVATAQVADSLDPSVDACVARVVQRMVFPKPQGGGVVVVSYPFVFEPAEPPPPRPAPSPSKPKSAPAPAAPKR
jgi:TonB family protein